MNIRAEMRNDYSSWSCAIGEEPPRPESLQGLLHANHRLSLIKYGLDADDVLTLKAQVPTASSSGRVSNVVARFIDAIEMYETGDFGGPALTDHAVDDGDALPHEQALLLLGEACANNRWTYDRPRIGVPTGHHDKLYLSVETAGSNLIISKELLRCPESMSDETSIALALWLLRANNHVRYINVSLTEQAAMLVARLPFEQLTSDECTETVRAVRTAFHACHQETQAILNHEVAVAYLRETALHYNQLLIQENQP